MNKHHYQRYQRFISSRALRALPLGTYTESHHIVPRSLGGTDAPSNLVILTGREHFIAHWMLFLAFKNPSMAHAYMMLHHVDGDAKRFLRKHKPRESRAYHAAKTIVAGQMSMRTTGMTIARNLATGELEHVSVKDLMENPNLVHHMTGAITARRVSTGEHFHVTLDELNSDPDLVHLSTGHSMGESSAMFTGWWVTPTGKYPSKRAAGEAMNLSEAAIDNRCNLINKKPLARHALNICTDLTKEEKDSMTGYCWADFGWGFQPKDSPELKFIPGKPRTVNGSPLTGKQAMRDPQTGEVRMYTKDEIVANPGLVHVNKGRTGDKAPGFIGWWITPKGRFAAKEEAMAAHGMKSPTGILNRCKVLNDKVVTAHSLQCNKDMTKEEKAEAVGKTWKELGWDFEKK